MRDKLAKEIKKRFGAAYGSREIKSIRSEIVGNALARYDEELAKGATEEAAYRTALGSVGDIKELLDTTGVSKKKRSRGLAVTIPITAVLLLLSFVPLLVSPDADPVLCVFLLIPAILLGFGLISLVCGFPKKGLSITTTVLGASAYLFFGAIMLFVLLVNIMESNAEKYRFDFTGEISNIESIEIVEITDPADYEDKFGYEVIGSVPSERYADALSRIAALEYTQPVGIPPELRKGDTIFIIRFREPKDGLEFVIIGYKCPGYGETNENGVKILTQPYWCDRHEFETLLSDLVANNH